MNKGVAILAVCALFVSGVVIGVLGMHLYYVQKLTDPWQHPAMVGRVMNERLVRELDLSEEQREEIQAILEDSRREGEEMRQRMRPEVEGLMKRTLEAIEEVLTPEQRERFEQMRRLDRRPIERLFLGPMDGQHGPQGGPRGRHRRPRP
jgi:Spy/CpxP family protein refolding chaperone